MSISISFYAIKIILFSLELFASPTFEIPPSSSSSTSNKELSIWENKKNKAYALIATSINEEVSHHISPFSNAFEALKKLKEIYDTL